MSVYSKASLLLSVAILVAATSSRAGELDGVVTPLATPVSLSVSGSQPVATYVVTLTNRSNVNTISNGRLVATTTIANGASDAKAVFKSASSTATCTASADGTRVDCSVGPLAVDETKQFSLTFFSPASGTSIDLDWDAVFDSGTPPGGSNGTFGTATIDLEAIDPTMVTSAVPGDETLTVFTGNLALPDDLDQFTVAITVPPVSKPTTASVFENVLSESANCRSLRNFEKCYESEILVPEVEFTNSADYLTFFLQIDKSNIRNGSKISKVLIQYDHDNDASNGISIVQYCATDSSGNAIPNTDDPPTPCIVKADDFTRKSPLGWFGYRWTIISRKNGRFTLE